MKALRLPELRELLQGAPFTSWWTELSKVTAELGEARARGQDLLSQAELMELRSELVQRAAMDAFSEAGAAEAVAARGAAHAQELENQALALVGHHEEQRDRASAAWYRLCGGEGAAEEASDAASRKALEKQLGALRQEYAAEAGKRDRLWGQVEAAWATSFEQSLLAHEHADRSRRIRKEAERRFAEAEERKQRARQLKVEAATAERERIAAAGRRDLLLDQARRELGCAAGDGFLYWRHAGDQRAAFAVALADGPTGTGAEVRALGVYTVGPQRGIELLEPARDGLARTVEEGDRRFEEYLLGPRRGQKRGEGEPGAGGTP